MDFDPRRVAVNVVGFSMAMVGMILSVIAPAISSAIPSLQPSMPALVIKLPSSSSSPRRIPAAHGSDSSNAGAGSGSGSAASAESVVTSSSSATSSLSSAGPSSPVDDDDAPQFIDVAPVVKQPTPTREPHSPRACLSLMCRMRNQNSPKRMSSIDSSSSSAAAYRCRDTQLSSSPPASAGASPAHSVLNFSPRSSVDVDASSHPRKSRRGPTHLTHASSASLDGHLMGPRALDEACVVVANARPVGRRARTFLGFSRSKKQDRPSALSHPPADARIGLEEEGEDDVFSEPRARRSRSLTSSFSKWRGKGKRKEKNAKPQSSDVTLVDTERPLSRSETVTAKPHSKTKCPFSRARANSDAAVNKPLPLPPPPPARTQPYSAPYNFPMPASPEAVDYVQRARVGLSLPRAMSPVATPQTATSPPFAAVDRRKTARHSFHASPSKQQQPRPILASASSAPPPLGSGEGRPLSGHGAPGAGARVSFVSSHSHVRSASLNGGVPVPVVDELGMLASRAPVPSLDRRR